MPEPEQDAFPILGIDYIQFFVGNAKQAAHYYRALGFRPVTKLTLDVGRGEIQLMLQMRKSFGLRLPVAA